jgi:CMP-N-acetylneuraminic acid synthetase
MTSVAAVIPIKTNNVRFPGKNTKMLCGKPLYQHMFDTIKKCKNVNSIFVDSSDAAILEAAEKNGFKTILRPETLNTPDATGNDLLTFELQHIKADIIVQTFVTLPLLTSGTIDTAVQSLIAADADSVLALHEIYDRFWYDNVPINHIPTILQGTQFMKPVCCETGFYVFKRSMFELFKTRVSDNKINLIVDINECIDIDNERDFLFAEAMLNKRP